MATYVHVIEHAGMAGDLSAATPRAHQHAGCMQTFRDRATFRAARTAVETWMAAHGDDRHMVVICTHGWEDTGTWLDMGDDDAYPVLNSLFRRVPDATLIYMAVCWGGYAAVVTRARECDDGMAPLVVGALAPLTADEGNRLQDQLLDVLVAHGTDEARLGQVVTDFNAALHADYEQPTARIAMRNGRLNPVVGAAGIAWSLLRHPDDSPNEGPFDVIQVQREIITVEAGESQWTVHDGWLQRAKGQGVEAGDRFAFKAKQQPGGHVLKILPPARFN